MMTLEDYNRQRDIHTLIQNGELNEARQLCSSKSDRDAYHEWVDNYTTLYGPGYFEQRREDIATNSRW